MKNLFAKIAAITLVFCVVSQAAQNIVVIFDESGSMAESMGQVYKIDAAKRGLNQVVNGLPADTNIGILTLNHGWLVTPAIIDKPKISSAINSINAGGGTPLGSALKTGADALLAMRAKAPYGSFRLLIVTDGEETDHDTLEHYYPDVISRGITFDVIGVNMSSEHSLAKAARSYKNVTDGNALQQAMHDALAETTVNSNSDESDFDWIAPLPDDFAKSVVSTLSEIPTLNYPIGDQPPPKAGGQQPQSQAPAAQATPVAAGPTAGEIVLIIMGVLLLIVVVFVVVAMLSSGSSY